MFLVCNLGKTLLGSAIGRLRLGPVLRVRRVATIPATEVGQTSILVLPLVIVLLSLVLIRTVHGSISFLRRIAWGYTSNSVSRVSKTKNRYCCV